MRMLEATSTLVPGNTEIQSSMMHQSSSFSTLSFLFIRQTIPDTTAQTALSSRPLTCWITALSRLSWRWPAPVSPTGVRRSRQDAFVSREENIRLNYQNYDCFYPIAVNCTDDPPVIDLTGQGRSSWDGRNRSYTHEIRYRYAMCSTLKVKKWKFMFTVYVIGLCCGLIWDSIAS